MDRDQELPNVCRIGGPAGPDATGAGIAKGTLYLHFKSEVELLDSVVAYCFEPVEREYAAIIHAEPDPVWKLEQCALASIMAHHILSRFRETIEEDVRERMDLYLNGLAK